MRCFTVLKDGGEYTQRHADWLISQCPQIEVLSLVYDWPRWWSKMELFRPDLKGDILFFDLDTVILGDISKFYNLDHSYVLRDFFYPDNIGSGMMYLKERDRAVVWDAWVKSPELHMNSNYGDQDFLKPYLLHARRWQDDFDGEVISYKTHLDKSCKFYKSGYTLDNARVVCFHGKPRPWDLDLKWIPRLV